MSSTTPTRQDRETLEFLNSAADGPDPARPSAGYATSWECDHFPSDEEVREGFAFGSFVTVPSSVSEIDAQSSRGGTAAATREGICISPRTCAALRWTIALGIWVEPPSWCGRRGTPGQGRGTALPVDQPTYRWRVRLVRLCRSRASDALELGEMTRAGRNVLDQPEGERHNREPDRHDLQVEGVTSRSQAGERTRQQTDESDSANRNNPVENHLTENALSRRFPPDPVSTQQVRTATVPARLAINAATLAVVREMKPVEDQECHLTHCESYLRRHRVAGEAGYVRSTKPNGDANGIGSTSFVDDTGYRQIRSLGIASMISWRGVRYVVHLGAIFRSSDVGLVDDSSVRPGTSIASPTC